MENMENKQNTIIASFDRFAIAVIDRLNNIDFINEKAPQN
jgi:putative NADH-flavin reductase